MERLLLSRVFIKNRNVTRVFFIYVFVISVTMSFSLLTLVMYVGYHSPFEKSEYDYSITEFDKNSINELNNREGINGTYCSRTVNTEIICGDESTDIELNLVDCWDENSISPFGKHRFVRGEFNNSIENGILLDYTLSRKLNARLGDTVEVAISDEMLEYVVIAILEPFPENSIGQAVCLHNDYFTDTWKQRSKDEIGYSLLFVDAETEDLMDDYFYNEYEIPGLKGVQDDEYAKCRRNSISKKEWLEADADKLTYYTPPITIIISILGTILLMLFVLRGITEICTRLERMSAILIALGGKYKRIAGTLLCGEFMIMLPAMVCSVIIVKLIYGILIEKYYLSWNLLGIEVVWMVVSSICIFAVASVIINKKYSKKLIIEYFNK